MTSRFRCHFFYRCVNCHTQWRNDLLLPHLRLHYFVLLPLVCEKSICAALDKLRTRITVNWISAVALIRVNTLWFHFLYFSKLRCSGAGHEAHDPKMAAGYHRAFLLRYISQAGAQHLIVLVIADHKHAALADRERRLLNKHDISTHRPAMPRLLCHLPCQWVLPRWSCQ